MNRAIVIIAAAFLALTSLAQQKSAPPPVKKAAPKTATKAVTPPVPAVPVVSPLAPDPVNPHYFHFRGRTLVLIGSGEHYGAILNTAFDYTKYLDALAETHLNFARIVNGTYVETADNPRFPGDQNTLAPRVAQYLAPWARSGEPGYAGGGRKFDLTQWDEEYFTRLRDFITEAGKRNIIVEVTLFTPQYGDGNFNRGSWNLNPLKASNNINQLGNVPWDRFNTLDEPALAGAQDALVRKTVTELNGFDNVYYEVCSEPWFSGASKRQTRDWLNHIAPTIQATEAGLPLKHLVADALAAPTAVSDAAPAPAILSFHAAYPPAALSLNWNLKKPVIFDEPADNCNMLDRRREAWTFFLSGGAGYHNVDLAFTTDDATGKKTQPNCQGVRYELAILSDFMDRTDLSHLQPDSDLIRQWPIGAADVFVLDDPGRTYAMYFRGGRDTRQTTMLFEAPPGRYQAEWLNPRTGESGKDPESEHPGGVMKLETPGYAEDLALRLLRTGDIPAPPKPEAPPVTKAITKAPARPAPPRPAAKK